jgi:sugar/nucleoside kinase (ribokinase family)
VRVTTLGDLLLDVIVRLDGPLEPNDDRQAETRLAAGGQAANVAAWVAALGGTARFVGKRGDDTPGALVVRELSARGVAVEGPVGGRTGVVVSLAESGRRSMASDRGSARELSAGELDRDWFACDVLHISGYALTDEPIASAAAHAAELGREQGARVAVDLSARNLVDDAFRARVRALRPHLVFAVESEREALGELESEWIVKRGAAGVVAAGEAFPAHPADVVDPTGAGDAFAAGYLVGGVELGLAAASRCVSRLGAMP